MADPAVFQGSLVNLKNSPTHKSVVLQVEVPEEYGEAIVRAFGWPTRVKPLPVAVARLEGDGEAQKRGASSRPEPKRFEELSYPEQAGILCKDAEFAEFMHVFYLAPTLMDAASAVRWVCGVKSRADVKPHEPSGVAWETIVENYRRWQDERDRADPGF